MARDDYFVIVYKILAYLYECLKNDSKPDIYFVLQADTYNISENYFEYIFYELQKDNYIEGVKFIPIQNKIRYGIKITPDIMITPKGIEYLQENSMLSKAKNIIKELNEIIPGL